jgi:hypothetical protein
MTTANLVSAGLAPSQGTAAPLLDLDPAVLRAGFDRTGFLIGHRLADHPLFALPQLVELARNLPEKFVEYNAGNVPVSLDPTTTPRTGLSVEETIRRIEECRSWLVLKNVEQDPDYRELLHRCLAEVEAVVPEHFHGLSQREAFVFVSSPGSVTPYHLDPEHNFLLQIRGTKQISLWDRDDRTVLSEEELEAQYSGGHRNKVFRDEYQARATVFELTPGKALHFPVTAPHWVKNGDAVSVSFSITFQTRATERRATVYYVNSRLRKRGWTPTPYGRSPWRDGLKYNAFRVARRVRGLLGLATGPGSQGAY